MKLALGIALTFCYLPLSLAQEPVAPPQAAPPATQEAPATPPAVVEQAPPLEKPVQAPAPVQTPPPTPAPKISKIGKVSQIFRDKKRIVVPLDSSIANNASLPESVVVTSPAGEACEGRVIQTQERMMLVDLYDCPIFDQIKAGHLVTPPAFVFTEPPPEPAPAPVAQPLPQQPQPEAKPAQAASTTPDRAANSNRPRFLIAGGLNSATELKFDSMTITDGVDSATGSYSYKMDSATQLAAGIFISQPYNWGFYGGITLESKRTMKSEKVTIEDSSATAVYTGEKPSLTFTLFEANALYRWNNFYLPFGINYVSPKMSVPSTGVVVETEGGVGAQLGIGIFVNDRFHLELYSQVITIKMTIDNPPYTLDLGTGHLSGAVLRAGVSF